MKAINSKSKIKILWKIWRGVNKISEDFNSLNTNLKVFLVGGCDTYAMGHVINREVEPGYDVIEIDVYPNTLAEGVYNLKALWTKNQGRDMLTSMRSGVFGITSNVEEAEVKDEEVRLVSMVESYGRDGMSAFETAVLQGLAAVGSEREWVGNEAERISNENKRVFAESKRVSSEADRESSETERINAEEERVESERKREEAEKIRVKTVQALKEQVNNYSPIIIEGDVTNAADEEDITSDPHNLLKLKDRTAFNGMGYKIMRIGKTFKSQLTMTHTIYEIRYDFDLDGARVAIPADCVLKYVGGSLSNGTIVYNNTIVEGIEKLNNVVTEGEFKYPYTTPDTEEGESINDQLAPTVTQVRKLSTEITNIADDEDLTKIYDSEKGQEVLQLKDRQYVQGSNNGMGYVILRKSKSFAEQVTKKNTIYEIRYDFDLGGEEVEIPENCGLKFEGGSLSDGKLTANDLLIKSSYNGILKNITFGGQFAKTGKIKLDWYITQYPKNDEDYSIDNTEELKFVFNSGIKNVVFPNKYIHLTDTIRIGYGINIYIEKDDKHKNWSFHPSNVEKKVSPCIFSKNIITFFKYDIDIANDPYDSGSTSLYIGEITCFCKTEFEDFSNINTAIIDIQNTSNLWGVIIDANITAKRRYVTIGEDSDWLLNYTGIKIATKEELVSGTGAYISFVRINGNIVGTAYGIHCKGYSHTTSSWFTDVIVTSDTECMYGGVFDQVTPVTIYGNHQTTILNHRQDNDRSEGYFTGDNIYVLGYVWDCYDESTRSKLRTVSNPVRIIGSLQNSFERQKPYHYYSYFRYDIDNVFRISPLTDFYPKMQNLLYRALTPRNPNNFFIHTLTYEIGDDTNGYVSLLTDNSDLMNGDNLFNDIVQSGLLAAPRNYNNCAIVSNTKDKVVKITINITDVTINGSGQSESNFPCYLYWAFYENNADITITASDRTDEIYHYSDKGSYYDGRLHKVRLDTAKAATISIVISCNTCTSIILPTLIIPSYASTEAKRVAYNKVSLPNYKNNERYGEQIFDLSDNTLRIWNGTKWVDSLGIEKGIYKSGNSSLRPENMKSGFQYFDTTLNKPIWWTGTKWVDATGAEV